MKVSKSELKLLLKTVKYRVNGIESSTKDFVAYKHLDKIGKQTVDELRELKKLAKKLIKELDEG